MLTNLYYRLKFFFCAQMIAKPLVSVVVPVFNAGKYLNQTVKKILKQSYTNLEIIFVDDGSNDNSYEILKKFKGHDTRVSIIQQDNQGPGSARNTGLKHALGEFILFHDADDSLQRRAVKRLLTLSLKTNSEVSAGITYFQKKNGVYIFKSAFKQWDFNIQLTADKERAKHYASQVSVCNKLFKTSFLREQQIAFRDSGYFEDCQFWAKVMLLCQSYTQSPYLISLYRYNPDSFTRGRLHHLHLMLEAISQTLKSISKMAAENQQGSFEKIMVYSLLHKPFRFILGCIFVSKNIPELLKRAQPSLEGIPINFLIDFYYDKNKYLALLFLAVRWGYIDVAMRLHDDIAYRKNMIKQISSLKNQDTHEFYLQFSNCFLGLV